MKMLILTHKVLGQVAQEVITITKTKSKIEHDWSKKYGQQFKQCSITSIGEDKYGDEDRPAIKNKPIKDLKTGDIYKDLDEAKDATGLSIFCVYDQLRRNRKPGFDYRVSFV